MPTSQDVQPPPYDAGSKVETDIATEIKIFADNVFSLKEDWLKVIPSVQPISPPAADALTKAYESYSRFIEASQDAAVQSRTSIIQTFVEAVVASATDPGATLKDQDAEAHLLEAQILKLSNSKWTVKDTEDLKEHLNDADGILRKKMEDDKQKAESDLSRALDELDTLNAKHALLQIQIADLLRKESAAHAALRFVLRTLLMVLTLTPGSSFRIVLIKYLGSTILRTLVELDEKMTEDENVLKQIKQKKDEIVKLRNKKKTVEDQIPGIHDVQLNLQELKGNFMEIAPKLDQICIIKDTVKVTLEEWIAVLNEAKTKGPDYIRPYVDNLVATSNVLTPISNALAGFVGRKN
ncbi:hypothetical protein SCHPADRAFT_929280 [Schizopora paradoxa]|uniref:Uncharacterized protein n=1 Tax=Schizopora paradoxa TaxID=27342 RepID=A0A0H2S667_9AGAM|nr:hypothetical protein SCHPADRAFT_929280 [Schizopora paradoxa]